MAKKKTTIRAALVSGSELEAFVKDGCSALRNSDRRCIDATLKSSVTDSIDLDAAMRKSHPHDNRWDYLIGMSTKKIVGVEPHSARDGEITVVVKKKKISEKYLIDRLKDGKHISTWIWVASGNVFFADTEKMRRILDQNGIIFAGKRVMLKHLPP